MVFGCVAQVLPETAPLPPSRRFPKTSSLSASSVSGSTEVFVTSTVNVAVPPGSASEPGVTFFETSIDGRASL